MTSNIDVTGLLLTYNEAPNIERTLGQLQWLPRIVIVDSYSTDETLERAGKFPNTDIFQRSFDDHTSQWNFGLQKTNIDSEWILAMDADYFIPEALNKEIKKIVKADPVENAFWLHFDYAIEGNVIRSGIYPAVQALYRREHAIYKPDGHTQRVEVSGKSGELTKKAIHDDRKSLSRWVQSQLNYAGLEAEKLTSVDAASLNRKDRFRLNNKLTPFLVFIYCIFARSGWRDGPYGWLYAFQRLIAEILLQYKLIQQRIN